MTTAKVEIWKDVGYTEGCLDAPSQTSSLPSPNATFTGLQISRETLFSQFKVKQAYEDLYDCSYVRMTMDMNNGDDVVLYGWIDKVSCSSDTPSSPVTAIDWHVDYWRSFLSEAVFGSGTVTKRPESGTVPPQTYSNMTLLATDTAQNLIPVSDVLWVFINLTATNTATTAGNKIVATYCYPVSISNPQEHIHVMYSATDMGEAPSLAQTLTSEFDEKLGIDPDAIYGCWISPIPPSIVTERTVSGAKGFSMSHWYQYQSTYSAFRPYPANTSKTNFYPEQTVSVNALTTDTEQFVVTDFDGQPIYSFPWGVSVDTAHYRLVNCDTSMYISVRFTGSNTTEASGCDSLTCSIPLKSIPMSSNARSSYVYSGQQEYDREQMNIQRQQALVSSLTSTMTGTTSNVVMAGLGNSTRWSQLNSIDPATGKVIPGKGATTGTQTKSGLGMGPAAALTLGAGIAGASIDYLASGYFNDSIMDSTMKYKSAQTSTLTLPGSGADWLYNGFGLKVRSLKWDDYSIAQRQADIDLYGISVNEPMTSCQAIIDAGGPLRIRNLTVTGKIPVGAKTYFRERFAQGVRIV